MAWHEDLLVGFDLETTGTDPRQARIQRGDIGHAARQHEHIGIDDVGDHRQRPAEALRISAKINSSAHDSGLELGSAVAAIAEILENAMHIRHKVNVHATIRRNLLTEAEVSGVPAKIARL